ncbi:MAG: xanthine dehydrogenase accessory protein XdhC [Oligoflexia bacterium]|nr:xanthine dehydrogenase accessory protein XdhC [Oligoflexia bacterium]
MNQNETCTFFQTMLEMLKASKSFVQVTVLSTERSVPQISGAKMLVTEESLSTLSPLCGTIGGGELEKQAVTYAGKFLKRCPSSASGDISNDRTEIKTWNLAKDLKMTCGGEVQLFFEKYASNPFEVVIFGAGHVAQALVKILLTLDCKITCIDMREEWLNKFPTSPSLTTIHTDDLTKEVANLHENSFVVIMTPGHAYDEAVSKEVLLNRNFPYVGVISSKTKSEIMKKKLVAAGVHTEKFQHFFSPIGLSLGNSSPAEIAISITSQLLQERDLAINK